MPMTRSYPAIIVLGARVLPDGTPSRALLARVERAAELFHEGRAPLLVLTGGKGDQGPSEAQVMLRIARDLGVPESACLLEEASRSTWENAKFTARLLDARGIREAIVVTDPYHLFRARQNFFAHGLDVVTVAARLEERNISRRDRVKWTAREVFALLKRPQLLFAKRPKITAR